MVLQLLIVSTNAVLVLDQRTLGIKYRIPVTEIEAMSLSPYFDRVLILHLRKVHTFSSVILLSIEWNSRKLGDHTDGIVTKTVHKHCLGVGLGWWRSRSGGVGDLGDGVFRFYSIDLLPKHF